MIIHYNNYISSLDTPFLFLILDVQDLYRYTVDDFVLQYLRSVKDRNVVLKSEGYSNRVCKRQFLTESKRREMISKLDKYFETKVAVPRINRGRRQEIETLTNEEALLLAKYLRGERDDWKPRIVTLPSEKG